MSALDIDTRGVIVDYPSFNLKDFVEKIPLPGKARLTEVRQTDVPDLVMAVIAHDFEVLLRPSMRSSEATIEMHMVVAWTPEVGVLEYSAPIEIKSNIIKDPDIRFAVLVDAANRLNYEESSNIGKIVIYRDEADGQIIAVLNLAIIIPKESIETAESVAALQIVLGANMARLYGGALKITELLNNVQEEAATSRQKKPRETRMLH